jgi:hypothetical protein
MLRLTAGLIRPFQKESESFQSEDLFLDNDLRLGVSDWHQSRYSVWVTFDSASKLRYCDSLANSSNAASINREEKLETIPNICGSIVTF